MIRGILTCFVFVSSLLSLAQANAQDLTIVYQERVPYYVIDQQGKLQGLVGAPIQQALKKAGIKAKWVISPPSRQMEIVRSSKDAVCAPGWFKNPVREKFALFSDVIYQDQPQVIVLRKSQTPPITHQKAVDLFEDRRFTLGTKLGYSYGDFIDQHVARQQPPLARTAQDIKGMFRMLMGGRFDYLITAPEEFDALTQQDKRFSLLLKTKVLSDIPPGNKRYLMCSKATPKALIQRINQALE